MNFLPETIISEVLLLLEDVELSWIAEEIGDTISRGKTEIFIVHQSKTGSEFTYRLGEKVSSSDSRASTDKTRAKLSPFTEDEQIEIVNTTLKNYALEVSENIEYILLRVNNIGIDSSEENISIILSNDENTHKTDLNINFFSADVHRVEEILKNIKEILITVKSLSSEGDPKIGN